MLFLITPSFYLHKLQHSVFNNAESYVGKRKEGRFYAPQSSLEPPVFHNLASVQILDIGACSIAGSVQDAIVCNALPKLQIVLALIGLCIVDNLARIVVHSKDEHSQLQSVEIPFESVDYIMTNTGKFVNGFA